MSTVDSTPNAVPYNLRAAARALGRSTGTVSYWLNKGELFEVASHGKQRLISAESVQRKAREIGVTLEAIA